MNTGIFHPAYTNKFSVRFYDLEGNPFASDMSCQITEIDSSNGHFVFEVPSEYDMMRNLLEMFYEADSPQTIPKEFSMAIFVYDGSGKSDDDGVISAQVFKHIKFLGMKLNDVKFHYTKKEPFGMKVYVSKPPTPRHTALVFRSQHGTLQDGISKLLTS